MKAGHRDTCSLSVEPHVVFERNGAAKRAGRYRGVKRCACGAAITSAAQSHADHLGAVLDSVALPAPSLSRDLREPPDFRRPEDIARRRRHRRVERADDSLSAPP
jgi:hypothetical protein